MKALKKKSFFYLIPIIILMIISFLNMANSALLSSLYKYNLEKQIIWYTAGFLILFFIQKLNIQKILKWSFVYYLLSVLLLILVLFFGKEVNGAKAWFKIGFLAFQPSELMKFTLVLYLIDVIDKKKITNLKSEVILILKVLIITLIPSLLVFIEPDTGAILFYLIIACSMLFISGIKRWWFIILFGLILVFLGSFIILYLYNADLLIKLIGTSFFYRVERLITFTTESSYQLENALTVIGSATLLGSGLHKVGLYIPEAPTDFIFAFNIGNFGILSGFIVLFCYISLDILLIHDYFRTKDKKIKLFLISFISIFLFQQVINISMNLGLLPIIGIPLPFLSYGGSTIIIYFLFIALVLKFRKNNLKSLI